LNTPVRIQTRMS